MSNSLLDKRLDELYPRKHMKAEDLRGRAWTVKIAAVKEVKVFNPRLNQEEAKIAVCFENAQRYLLINKTQAAALFAVTDAETARGWVGHRVMIVPARTRRGQWTIEIMEPPREEAAEREATTAAEPAPAGG